MPCTGCFRRSAARCQHTTMETLPLFTHRLLRATAHLRQHVVALEVGHDACARGHGVQVPPPARLVEDAHDALLNLAVTLLQLRHSSFHAALWWGKAPALHCTLLIWACRCRCLCRCRHAGPCAPARGVSAAPAESQAAMPAQKQNRPHAARPAACGPPQARLCRKDTCKASTFQCRSWRSVIREWMPSQLSDEAVLACMCSRTILQGLVREL